MNSYTYLSVAGQSTINLTPVNNTLTVVGGNGITVTTNSETNTLTFNASDTISIANLTVTDQLVANPSTTGSINNTTIGLTSPNSGQFTTLTATTSVSLNPTNGSVTILPSGTVTINPTTTGTMDNITIGGNIPASATFTSVTVTGNFTCSGNNSTITLSPTGSGLVTINPTLTGSINNMTIGSITPAAGTFTTVSLTTQPAGANSPVTIGYAATLAAAYGMIMC